jgi:hypothetical protein
MQKPYPQKPRKINPPKEKPQSPTLEPKKPRKIKIPKENLDPLPSRDPDKGTPGFGEFFA